MTDIPMAIIGHVDFNCRAIELKRKVIGDLWHGVLLVLGRQKMRCHMAPHLLLYRKDRMSYDILSFACSEKMGRRTSFYLFILVFQ